MMDILGPRMIWQGEVNSIERAEWPQTGFCLMGSIRLGIGGANWATKAKRAWALGPLDPVGPWPNP